MAQAARARRENRATSWTGISALTQRRASGEARGGHRSAAALSGQIKLLRRECTVTLDFFLVFRNGANRVMQQVSAEAAWLAFEAQGFVDDSRKLSCVWPV